MLEIETGESPDLMNCFDEAAREELAHVASMYGVMVSDLARSRSGGLQRIAAAEIVAADRTFLRLASVGARVIEILRAQEYE